MSDSVQLRSGAIDPAGVAKEVSEWLERSGIVRTGVLVGVSGGADSVGLLRAIDACRRGLSLDVCVAHLDHALRGESAADAAWVQELSARLAVPCVIERSDVSTLAAESGRGVEETARRARYDFFLRAAAQRGCTAVAVAHTADDQAETILHHVIRGTGLAGLRGMPEMRPLSPHVTLIRPLLNVSREEVLHSLEALGQDYRADRTNDDAEFTRNRLRHKLLPLLRDEFNPQVGAALRRLGSQVEAVQQLVEELASDLLQSSVIDRNPDFVRLRSDALRAANRHLVREALCRLWTEQHWPRQRMGFDDWDRLATLAQSAPSSKSCDLPHGVTAARRGSTIEIRRARASRPAEGERGT